MTSKASIDDFLSQRKLALVGMSGKKKKFGNVVAKELESKGYEIFPVHPHESNIDGLRCWPSLAELPEPVDGLILVVPPSETEKVVREAAAAGIARIWMQQGAESNDAIRFCAENNISVVHNECILMFAEPPAFIHRLHRWVRGLMGRLPK
jgi:predicted CoA-binding protein